MKKRWLQMVGVFVLLAVFVSCGESGSRDKVSSASDVSSVHSETSSTHSETSSAHSATHSSDSSSVTSSVTLSAADGGYVDKSEYIMNLFGGEVMGNKGSSGLVYDLDFEEYDKTQKIIDKGGFPFDVRKDYIFPQVTFDSEDGRKFNEHIQEYANTMLHEWSDDLVEYLQHVKDVVLANGFRYVKYGVIESEKYLSMIVVSAYTDTDYTKLTYVIDSYVFEKETGRFVSFKELMDKVSPGGAGLLYDGIANFCRFVVKGEKEQDIGFYYHLNYILGSFLDDIQDDNQGDITSFFNDPNRNIGISFYVDASGEPRVLFSRDFFVTMLEEGNFEPVEKTAQYTCYNGKVFDVPLLNLQSKEPSESKLYHSVRERFGIQETPDVLLAYIGIADDYTVRAFQTFVDLFEVQYQLCDLATYENYESKEYAPRSVYLVIPRYQNAVTKVSVNHTSGFAVISVNQNENALMPFCTKFGEKEIMIHQPVEYHIGESRIEQEDVYDFTDALFQLDDPKAEVREEIEIFFSSVRTMG